MVECEDCSVNGMGCVTHGAAASLPVVRALITLTDRCGGSEYRDALSWLREQESLYEVALMAESVACSSCGEWYDEHGGDGYCGLCPSCADASEPEDE